MFYLIGQKVDIYPNDGKHPFARTGDLSFYHLKKAGASGVLIGHSEAGESIEEVNKKLKAAWDAGLQDNIVLLGEKEEGEKTIKERLTGILEGIDERVVKNMVLAYEPAWAIQGSGKVNAKPPTLDYIKQSINIIRDTFLEIYNEECSQKIPVLYGGSVSPEEAPTIAALPDIDGFILGSAGTKTSSALTIIKTLREKKERTPILALNWKAYQLEEPYETFIEALKPFAKKIDIYLAPTATDIYQLSVKLKVKSEKYDT